MIRKLMLFGVMLGLCTPAFALKVQTNFPGEMTVEDSGAFSAEGKSQASERFQETMFKAPTEFTVVVMSRIPDRIRGEYARVKDNVSDTNRFVGEWANQEFKDRKLEGILVLISKEGGFVRVIADRSTDAGRDFGDMKLQKLRDLFYVGFRDASAVEAEAATQRRDKTLLDATHYVIDELRDTVPSTQANNRVTSSNSENDVGGGRSLMGWVCIGLCIAVVVWVVIGLFRAMSGAGGGYGGGGMGGGGGFLPSLMGGMFGAMAGMYLYDQFTGHDSAGDQMSSDDGMNDGGYDDGAGDIDGGGDSGSYDDGGGDFGGGDWGGGGGDFGGGDW